MAYASKYCSYKGSLHSKAAPFVHPACPWTAVTSSKSLIRTDPLRKRGDGKTRGQCHPSLCNYEDELAITIPRVR